MKAIIGALGIAVLLPAGWFAWHAYDMSVRWGTSNPCDMVAMKLSDDTGEVLESTLIRSARAKMLTTYTREDGAFACWKSLLFLRSTVR